MDYELAKELKDAGFPQEVFQGRMQLFAEDAEYYYLPTLSDLIAACPRVKSGRLRSYKAHRHNFTFVLKADPNGGWLAGYEWKNKFLFFGAGSEPEIAVATIWIALNKK